jgi:hypothetical protein
MWQNDKDDCQCGHITKLGGKKKKKKKALVQPVTTLLGICWNFFLNCKFDIFFSNFLKILANFLISHN